MIDTENTPLMRDRHLTKDRWKPNFSPLSRFKGIIQFFAKDEDKPLLQDPRQIDSLYKKYRMTVLLTTTLGYMFYYTCRLGLSIVRERLVSDGILTVEQTGMVGSAIFISYAIGKLTNGFFADHGNVRKLFSFGLLSSAIINLVMGSVTLFWVFVLCWGLNGWFQAFGAPSCGVTTVNWFSNHERGRYYSIWNASIPAGEALTFVTISFVITHLGWRAGFWLPGIFCILMSVLIYIFLRDRPRTLGLPTIQDWKGDHGVSVKADNKPMTTSELHKQILKYPRLWILTIAASFLYITRSAVSGWGVFYLQEAKDLSLASAGSIIGVGALAGIPGGIVYGFISDKLFNARRPPVTAIYGVIEIAVLLLIFYAPTTNPAVFTILFLVHGFVFSGLLIGLLLFAIDIMPKGAVGVVGGVVGIGSYIAAALTEHLSGYLVGRGVRIVDGVETYDFTYAIMFWVGAMVICLLLASTLWKTKFVD